jgi:hypothetical protein
MSLKIKQKLILSFFSAIICACWFYVISATNASKPFAGSDSAIRGIDESATRGACVLLHAPVRACF